MGDQEQQQHQEQQQYEQQIDESGTGAGELVNQYSTQHSNMIQEMGGMEVVEERTEEVSTTNVVEVMSSGSGHQQIIHQHQQQQPQQQVAINNSNNDTSATTTIVTAAGQPIQNQQQQQQTLQHPAQHHQQMIILTQAPSVSSSSTSSVTGVVSATSATTSLVAGPAGKDLNSQQKSIIEPAGGQYVVRGNQLVRIKSPTLIHQPQTTNLISTNRGSPVKVQVIGGNRQQIGGKQQVLLSTAPGQQNFVIKSSQPISGDHQVVMYPAQGSYQPSKDHQQEPLSQQQTPSAPNSAGANSKRKSVLPSGNRKPCNCTKSQCLKLYCECFANGEFCRDCNCKDCHNNLEHEGERTKAIKSSLERNPNAFQPKIGRKGRSDIDRMHQKGCHCKKSSCLKNYCECYEAKVPCSVRCKCVGCRNTEEDREKKGKDKGGSSQSTLLHLASAATADLRPESPFTDADDSKPDPKSMPWFYMTDEVVECTTLCLMAQAEELERSTNMDQVEMEKRILKEFGRCLAEIIENANQSVAQS